MTYQTGINRISAGRIAIALLASLAIFMVFAFSSARVVFADGSGSPAACETEDKFTPSGGEGSDEEGGPDRSVTITADEGEVITAVCIKSGSKAFGGNKHSDVISQDGLHDCYTVAGLGTNEVTVTAADSSDCQGISHVDFTTGPGTGDDDDDDDDDDTGDDDDDDDDDDTGDDDDDDDDDDGVAGGNPTPRDGTLGGNPVPDTAMTGPSDVIVPTLLTLFVLAGLGGLTALRLARRP
jgi:hypothetical protein